MLLCCKVKTLCYLWDIKKKKKNTKSQPPTLPRSSLKFFLDKRFFGRNTDTMPKPHVGAAPHYRNLTFMTNPFKDFIVIKNIFVIAFNLAK